MVDTAAAPLTDEEREELEALRAEKARREEEERARAEREELEALRAEQERVDAQILAERAAAAAVAEPVVDPAAVESAAAAERTVAATGPATAQRPASSEEPAAPAEKTFGQRMVTSDTVDSDGIPTMPAAQKIILALALVAAVAFLIYTFTR